MKSESQIQSEVLELLKSYNCWVVKTIKSNRKGIPDLIICLNGIFVAIELKKEGLGWKDATPLQLLELNKIVKAGGFSLVSSDLKEIKNFLDNINKTLIIV